MLVAAELNGKTEGEAYYQAEEGQQHLERRRAADIALFNGRSQGYLKFGNDVWGSGYDAGNWSVYFYCAVGAVSATR